MKSILVLSLTVGTMILLTSYSDNFSKSTYASFKPVIDVYTYAINSGDVDTLNAVCNPTFTRYIGLTRIDRGLDSVKIYFNGVKTSFPDFKISIDQEIYTDNNVLLRLTLTGTNTGPGKWVPTGRSFKVPAISLLTFKNGKLEEEHFERDGLSLMQQLGFTLSPPKN